MSKKKHAPSDGALREMLQAGHFGESQDLAPSDPITRTPMRLPISEIDLYDRNPRRSRNAKHDEIKESIRVDGVHQPPVITRRPGAPRYMIKRGGNTRLMIMRELFEETADPKFSMLDVIFEPWNGESSALIGHVIENEGRGDLTWFDKARAAAEMRVLLEGELGRKLSDQDLATELTSRGYKVSQPTVVRMRFTTSILADALPGALAGGLTAREIIQLQKLYQTAKSIWAERGLGDEAAVEAHYQEALRALDGDLWDIDAARREIEGMLADQAEVPLRRISVEFDQAELADQGMHVDEDPESNELLDQLGSELDRQIEEQRQKAERRREAAANAQAAKKAPNDSSADTQARPKRSETHQVAERSEPDPSGIPNRQTALPGLDDARRPPPRRFGSPPPADQSPNMWNWLRAMRKEAHAAAVRYASHWEMEAMVRPHHGGTGYLLLDLPAKAHYARSRSTLPASVKRRSDAEDCAMHQVHLAWWHLYGFADYANAHELAVPFLAEGLLSQALCDDGSTGSAGPYTQLCQTAFVDPGVSVLHQFGWQAAHVTGDWLDLFDLYRELVGWALQHDVMLHRLLDPEKAR